MIEDTVQYQYYLYHTVLQVLTMTRRTLNLVVSVLITTFKAENASILVYPYFV